MRFTSRRALIALILLCATAIAWGQSATEPLKIVVSYPAGGPTDRIARILADHLARRLSRSVVVENRIGASGTIAAEYVIHGSSPDNTLFLGNGGNFTLNAAIDPKLSYNPSKDFKPVTMVADTTTVLVTAAASDLKDAADLTARLRAKTRTFTGASSGTGGSSHLTLEMYDENAGVELLHVPYKGASQAVIDVAGGRVDVFFGDLPGLLELINGGKLKALAVIADQPTPLLPGVRTLTAQGVSNVVPSGWYGVVMPATASDKAVKIYADAIKQVLQEPDTARQYEAMGALATPSDPASFRAFLDADRPRWVALVQRRHLQPER